MSNKPEKTKGDEIKMFLYIVIERQERRETATGERFERLTKEMFARHAQIHLQVCSMSKYVRVDICTY